MQNIKAAVGGKFKIEAIRPDGTRRVLADWFDNIITDIGLDKIMANGFAISNARVGSGTSTPTATDTALESQVASTSNAIANFQGNASTAPYYGWCRRTYRFAAGVAAGILGEVGVGWSSTGDTLFSRALIKNSFGDPITITVLSDELLDVTYELRLYPDTTDVEHTFMVGATEITSIIRPSQVTSQRWQPFYVFSNGGATASLRAWSGAIGAVTASPSGSLAVATTVKDSYTAGSLVCNFQGDFALNQANFGAGGIKSAEIETLFIGSYQASFTPPILKDGNKLLTLNFSMSIERYTP